MEMIISADDDVLIMAKQFLGSAARARNSYAKVWHRLAEGIVPEAIIVAIIMLIVFVHPASVQAHAESGEILEGTH